MVEVKKCTYLAQRKEVSSVLVINTALCYGRNKQAAVLLLSLVCRLPIPRPGQVLGLVGTNGIGKSTALKVLAGKLKPNLGRFDVSSIDSETHLHPPTQNISCSVHNGYPSNNRRTYS